MSWQRVRCVKGALLLAAACLLMAPPARAGDRYRAAKPPAAQPNTAAAPVAVLPFRPVAVSVVVTPPPAAPEQVYVDLRGVDGQVRRFPVQGGLAAIESPQVVVLRPGESVTVRMTAK
jgi:hypothetical protein